jgi:hypothetical protein
MNSRSTEEAQIFRSAGVETFAIFYARIAVGAAFLSAVASRLGLWRGEPGLKLSPGFIQRTAELNFFMPASAIPMLAWSATVLEITLGLTLIISGGLGLVSTRRTRWTRWIALGSAVLLALFGTLMTITAGIKSPLDYSVFSASACALLLAVYPEHRKQPVQP